MKRFFFRSACVVLGGMFCCAVLGVVLHVATSDDLEYLVLRVAAPPQTARFEYSDDQGKIFDTETAPVNYKPVALENIDPRLSDDLIAVEDKNFFRHSGVDYARTFKAALELFGAARKPSGGSTLTQQLIKNLLSHHERSVWQKAREIYLARRLETRLSSIQAGDDPAAAKLRAKRIILESYWNHLFLTHRYRGVGYLTALFSRKEDLRSLNDAERTAVLALVRSPRQLSLSEPRTQRFLAHMASQLKKSGRLRREDGTFSPAFARDFFERYSNLRHKTAGGDATRQLQTPYARSVKNLFALDFARRPYDAGSFTVKTPRIAALDDAMRSILEKKLRQLSTGQKRNCTITGAYMLIRLSDAAVTAASEDACSEFNELVQARRQVSSTIKPLLYAHALKKLALEPRSIFTDKRVTVTGRDGKPYSPRNHYKSFRGKMNLKNALQISANTVSLQLYEKINPAEFIPLLTGAYARYPGENIAASLHPDYSLALGTIDLAPSHVASAYLTLIRQGKKIYPQWGKVSSGQPATIFERQLPEAAPPRQIFDPITSEQVREMLTAVLRPEGTGGEYLTEGKQLIIQELGAKSGSGPLDTWFVGFSEDLLLLVWLGFREYQGTERDFHAATLWYDLFVTTIPFFTPRPMAYSPELERRYFCANTGLPPDAKCPRIHSALFPK